MLFHVTLNLRRDTTPDQVRALLESITTLLKGNPKLQTGAMPVRFVGIGTYSLDIEIFIYVRTLNGDEFMKIQQDLFLSIMDAVEAAGTALAVPTQATIDYPASRRRLQRQLETALNSDDVDGLFQTLHADRGLAPGGIRARCSRCTPGPRWSWQ